MQKLTLKEKAGFSTGELAGSGLWQLMIIFLPAFYTDTFGIPAAAVGTLFFIVRIFDAINDPIMGTIADRTHTKWGKFRPYLVWIAVPFGIMTFMMFLAPELSESGKITFAYITYISMMVIYTTVMIPYSALSGVMTSDYWDRTSLNSFRFIGAFLAAMLIQGLVKPSVKFFGHGNEIVGFRWTTAIFGVVCVFAFLITFLTTKERIAPAKDQQTSLKNDFSDLIKNIPWLIILIVSLITLIYISIRSAAQIYYFKYYIQNEDMVSSFMVIGSAVTILAILLTKKLTELLDKKLLFMICMTLVGISSFFFYIVKPTDIIMLYVIQIIFSFASGPSMPLLWSMMGDTADYSEWVNKRRATGLVFSASTFAFKAGGALGGAIAMYLLSAYGYVANVQQAAKTLLGMRLMMSVWPAVAALLCVGVLAFYKLNSKLMKKIEIDLQSRKNELETA